MFKKRDNCFSKVHMGVGIWGTALCRTQSLFGWMSAPHMTDDIRWHLQIKEREELDGGVRGGGWGDAGGVRAPLILPSPPTPSYFPLLQSHTPYLYPSLPQTRTTTLHSTRNNCFCLEGVWGGGRSGARAATSVRKGGAWRTTSRFSPSPPQPHPSFLSLDLRMSSVIRGAEGEGQ